MSNGRIAGFYVALHRDVQDIGLRKRLREPGHAHIHIESFETQVHQLIADLQACTIEQEQYRCRRRQSSGLLCTFTIEKFMEAPRSARGMYWRRMRQPQPDRFEHAEVGELWSI